MPEKASIRRGRVVPFVVTEGQIDRETVDRDRAAALERLAERIEAALEVERLEYVRSGGEWEDEPS